MTAGILAAILLFSSHPASSAVAGCPWVKSHAPIPGRVSQLLSAMNLDQKIQLLHGTAPGQPLDYVGVVPAIPSLCLPELRLEDGPAGLGDNLTGVTQLPAPVSLASTWNPALAEQYGRVVGEEAWGKGVNINLGPTVNIVRDPRWGRAFETYGEDPHLAGQLAGAYIDGVQKAGPMAMLKHFAVYNQETNRNLPADNALIDERTMQEVYLPQFRTAIQLANPAAIMCSYSWIGGVAACENAYLLTNVLRDQWKYSGFVTSDWFSTHSTVDSANHGLDMEMPFDQFFGPALEQAVMDGLVSTDTVDQMLRPILTQMFRFKLLTRTQTGTTATVVTSAEHAATALKVAEEGTVLLKNSAGLLPLAEGHSITVIGRDAGPQLSFEHWNGSAFVAPPYVVTPYQGILQRAGSPGRVLYAQGDVVDDIPSPVVPTQFLRPSSGEGTGLTGEYFANPDLSGLPVATQNSSQVDFVWSGFPPISGVPGINWSARWTGTITVNTTGTYPFSVTSDDGSRLFINGQKIIDNWSDGAPHARTGLALLQAGQPASIEVDYYQHLGGASLSLGWQPTVESLRQDAVDMAASTDAAIVFVSKLEGEGADISNIDLPQDENDLIAAVAAANPNTIVVLNTGSAVTMPWIDQVKGVFEAWYPGQENGNAIAALLFGDSNPSGKLPVTFPRSLADVPAATAGQWPGIEGSVNYSEGIEVGYRWYDAKQIPPLFSFGHGLSYTSFQISHLRLNRTGPRTAAVTVDVTNTGARAGEEILQLYVGDPASADEPPRQLKAFQKIALNPHQTRRVKFRLIAEAFSIWDVVGGRWRIEPGVYQIYVGDSSDNLPVSAKMRVGG